MRFTLKNAHLVFLSFTFLIILLGCSEPNSEPTTYEIGDIGPAGGVVFYIDESDSFDWTYLEVAPNGWNGEADDPAADWWDGIGEAHEVGTSADIGAGESNTIDIANYISTGGGHAPAEFCETFVMNSDDDWWLPSKGEAQELFGNLSHEQLVSIGLAYADNAYVKYYWTSTERDSYPINDAWQYTNSFTNGVIGMTRSKTNSGFYRPIHSF
jgi:hypothetical protein